VARRVEPESAATELGAGDTPAAPEARATDEPPILLVDDRTENLRALEAVLAPLGYPLVTASSGGEALRLLLERDFALILLDVRMPGMDGLETARLIKGRARSAEVPIVFLTAARDEVEDIIRGYGVGAVDYVLKPFEPDLLRSKVAVFAQLETGRRALMRSEALLRGAFEAAPIGKTLLDPQWRIIRANPAFARLVGWSVEELQGIPITDLCQSDDVELLTTTLERVATGDTLDSEVDREVDLRLQRRLGSELWVAIVASRVESGELSEPLLMVQWVDLTTRQRAERARAELLLEQAARAQAEATTDRLRRLQALTSALESLSLEELLAELTVRLAEMLGARVAEVQIGEGRGDDLIFRASGDTAKRLEPDDPSPAGGPWEEAPLRIEGTRFGTIRIAPFGDRSLDDEERSLLREAADRAALSIRRAQLHEEEHRIAVELQRGLIPRRVPSVGGLELAAHYEAAGVGAEVGGDWYDAFELPGGRLGVVLGDVAGSGIRAASTMGQLRSVTRAFALADEASREPGEVLTLLNGYRVALEELGLFTVLYTIVDPGAGRIEWSNAGHPPPLLVGAEGERGYLEGGDGLMGVERANYQTLQTPFSTGDTLVLYTDGLVERRGESLDTGLDRLAHAAASGPAGAAELCEHVLRRLLPPEGGLHDDVTAVVVKAL
jgi:PAS domain S-box-containing protein